MLSNHFDVLILKIIFFKKYYFNMFGGGVGIGFGGIKPHGTRRHTIMDYPLSIWDQTAHH
jgi:hypothetical protein